MKYIFVFLLVLLFSVSPVFAAPASLSFEPANIQTTTGRTVDITVNIFTGSQPVASTDVWLTYDPSILEPIVDSVKTGSSFDTIELKQINPGTLYLYGIQKNPREVEPVQGTLATVQFIAIKGGASTIKFDCDSTKKTTSQIIASDKNLSNVISCPATTAHTASISVSENNILGVSTQNTLITQLSYILGVVVIIFSLVLFIRYQRIRHEISS